MIVMTIPISYDNESGHHGNPRKSIVINVGGSDNGMMMIIMTMMVMMIMPP